jgi:hypothetical protein
MTHLEHYRLSDVTKCSGLSATLDGKVRMKIVEFKPPLRVIGAVCLCIGLSASAGNAQSGPFAGFGGSWSGAGTVTLSNGSTERIRCKANYQVDAPGSGLRQTLRCASDSYKFDLSSNVTSREGNISGTWSEASRNLNGNLQGRVGDGQITVLVEAAAFAANLTMTTRGDKQSVSISSKGEIKGVSISMVRE